MRQTLVDYIIFRGRYCTCIAFVGGCYVLCVMYCIVLLYCIYVAVLCSKQISLRGQ